MEKRNSKEIDCGLGVSILPITKKVDSSYSYNDFKIKNKEVLEDE